MGMYMQLLKLNKQEKKRNLIEALRFFCFVELILISVIRQIEKMLYLDIDFTFDIKDTELQTRIMRGFGTPDGQASTK